MRVVRAGGDRGSTRREGSERRQAFSGGDHHDPAWMGWGALRVADEVQLAPGGSFGSQRRANMELLTYVIDGALRHRAADGGAHVVEAGGMQWIGAGHGIDVDDGNASAHAPLRVLQLWIQPDRVNAAPVRGQVAADASASRPWTTLVAPDAAHGGLAIRQHAWVHVASLGAQERTTRLLDGERRYWLQATRGALTVDGQVLAAGDALGVVDDAGLLQIVADASGAAALLMLDLPR